jgi:hypothetical protein
MLRTLMHSPTRTIKAMFATRDGLDKVKR